MKLNDEAEAEIKRLAKWWEDGLPLPEIYLRAAMIWAWAHPPVLPVETTSEQQTRDMP